MSLIENIVPVALQRLRAADIIRMAGLTAASLGQEYNRTGTIQGTQRQGACLRGRVYLPQAASALSSVFAENQALTQEKITTLPYAVEVEVTSTTSWTSSCSCDEQGSLLCAHIAALLYRWLAIPVIFETVDIEKATLTSTEITETSARKALPPTSKIAPVRELNKLETASLRASRDPNSAVLVRYSTDLVSILLQIGLGDLRSIAREYALVTNGMSKQQLAEMIVEAIQQPDVVRRVASTLEKIQRQLLAALSLAGGVISDDDLRGLFERFSLGQPPQLQRALLALQGKALLFHVNSLSSEHLTYSGGTGSMLDIGWFVPAEIRSALRVLVPVTSFDISQPDEKHDTFQLQYAQPYRVLSDVFLIARTLDGQSVESADPWSPAYVGEANPVLVASSPSLEQAALMSRAADLPSEALVAGLQKKLPFTRVFLRFAVQLLVTVGIVQKPERETPYLRLLPNAAQLLLGSSHAEVLRDFFKLWVQHNSAAELFALLDDGLRLLCRMTPLHVPVLHPGELEEENAGARQFLMALLAQAPTDQWMSFAAFGRFVYRLQPLFLQKRQRLFNSPHWWLEVDNGRPLKPMNLSDWQCAELHYLSRLIVGPLYWWGLCDVALSQQGNLLAFRLTPLAEWLLHERPLTSVDADGAVSETAIASVQVLDDQQVLVPCSLSCWPVIELFELFAEATGVEQESLRYRFTAHALSKALSQGQRPRRLLDVIRLLADQEVQRSGVETGPCTRLLAQLEQWLTGYGRVRIYTGVTLLETVDTAVMRELSATTSLSEQIIRTLHPTLQIVRKSAVERLTEDLKRRGQSPLLHDEAENGAE